MYWRFNELSGKTAGDSRRANDNAVYRGANPNSGTLLSDGKPGTAARFDGVDDWVKLPNRKNLNTGGPYNRRTVELWFRADTTNGRQVLFEEGGPSKGLNIYLAGDKLYGGAWNESDQDTTTPWPRAFVSVGGIEPNTTYHVAIVFNEGTDKFRLYLNGVLVDTDIGIGNIFAHSSRSAVGGVAQKTRFHDGASDPAGYYFDGKIDEVVIYNKALSTASILQRYLVGSGVS